MAHRLFEKDITRVANFIEPQPHDRVNAQPYRLYIGEADDLAASRPDDLRRLAALLRAAGRGATAEGLFGELVIDPARIRDRLGWQPAGPVREAVAAALGAVDADTQPSRESSCHNPRRR